MRPSNRDVCRGGGEGRAVWRPHITEEQLKEHFHETLAEAANALNVGETYIKARRGKREEEERESK